MQQQRRGVNSKAVTHVLVVNSGRKAHEPLPSVGSSPRIQGLLELYSQPLGAAWQLPEEAEHIQPELPRPDCSSLHVRRFAELQDRHHVLLTSGRLHLALQLAEVRTLKMCVAGSPSKGKS